MHAPPPAERSAATPGPSLVGLYLLFFASGFAALLYQVVWQRTLFSVFGINVEAVTVVITAFMLGLGLGSLVGGRVSARPGPRLLGGFAAVEAGIGLFGLASLPLFAWVGAQTLHLDPWLTALITFGLLLLPTLLMGATLPMLVAFLVRTHQNVGRSVGTLYFVNTLGSALASIAAVTICLRFLGQAASVWAAAGINFAVALAVLGLWRGARRLAADPPAGTTSRGSSARGATA